MEKTKSELIENLHKENEQWEALLAEIGEERMERPGAAGDWTMKDVIAHLTSWRKRTVARLEADLQGERKPKNPWPAHLHDVDEVNNWFYETNRDRPLSEVLAESRRVFEQMVAAVEALPEAGLFAPDRFYWMEGEPLTAAALFAHFHEEHEADIHKWLKEQEAT